MNEEINYYLRFYDWGFSVNKYSGVLSVKGSKVYLDTGSVLNSLNLLKELVSQQEFFRVQWQKWTDKHLSLDYHTDGHFIMSFGDKMYGVYFYMEGLDCPIKGKKYVTKLIDKFIEGINDGNNLPQV